MYQTLHQGEKKTWKKSSPSFRRKKIFKDNCLPSLKSTCQQVCFVGLKKTHLRHLFQVLKQQKRASGIPEFENLKHSKEQEKSKRNIIENTIECTLHCPVEQQGWWALSQRPSPRHERGTAWAPGSMWSYKRNNKSWDDVAISHGEKPLRKFLKNPHLNASWAKPCWDNKQCEPGCTLQTPSVDPATHECQPQSKCHKNRHRQTHPKYLQDTSKIYPSNTCAKCIKMLKFWLFPCPAQLLSLVRVVCAQSHCLHKKSLQPASPSGRLPGLPHLHQSFAIPLRRAAGEGHGDGFCVLATLLSGLGSSCEPSIWQVHGVHGIWQCYQGTWPSSP